MINSLRRSEGGPTTALKVKRFTSVKTLSPLQQSNLNRKGKYSTKITIIIYIVALRVSEAHRRPAGGALTVIPLVDGYSCYSREDEGGETDAKSSRLSQRWES